jgi:hypothetical protein
VLYRGPDTTITTAFVEAAGRRYPLAELESPRRVEHTFWRQTRWFELWARFRGEPVRLFRSRNGREFGRVCRALIRARELAGVA